MRIVDNVIDRADDFYHKVEDITKKRPILIIISTIALSVFSAYITPFSSILALSGMCFSLLLAYTIMLNSEEVFNKIEYQMKRIVEQESEREKGKKVGEKFAKGMDNIADKVDKTCERAAGFVEGVLFTK